MSGTYKKHEFGLGVEEQNLVRDANSTRIMAKGNEPVRLSPGWEGTGRPNDELNFNGVTMDQAELELNPPKDRMYIIYLIMVLHGIGVLMPWNMFITAESYFKDHKLKDDIFYRKMYLTVICFAAQVPNLFFNWFNVFMPMSGNTTSRIIWSLTVQAFIFLFTIGGAMIDTSDMIGIFFWVTVVTVVISNTANGIYQNSVFGMAAKLPGKYTGAVILGSNICGVFTSVTSIVTKGVAKESPRTAAIYYFITALFVIFVCFDTYFALPINRFYRYHELINAKEQTKRLNTSRKQERPPYWMIIKQCWVQLLNIFLLFFVTLSLFPSVQLNIRRSDPDFFISENYTDWMCFMTFNVTALIGSVLSTVVQWPSKKWLSIPIFLRLLYIPAFLFLCNYQPSLKDSRTRIADVLHHNDWTYLALGSTMGLSSGYFSSLAMMYCPTCVDSRYATTAGMFAAAALSTGILTGILFGMGIDMVMFQ